MNQGPLIEISGLSKQYAQRQSYSLKNVSLSISRGDRYGIFGPNGAGKTTLISIICGILSPTSGNVAFKAGKPRIGFVPQEIALYEKLSGFDNLEYCGALWKMSKQEIKTQSKLLLETLGLSDYSKKKIHSYSGGMKRRLNLAAALMHKPDFIVLDEPTVGIDIQSKNAIIGMLEELHAGGATILYTSHHLSEGQQLCNKAAVLDSGSLISCGSMEEIIASCGAGSLEEAVLELTGKQYRDYA
jgi:ABC-2 type transport system ATP-binding protein